MFVNLLSGTLDHRQGQHLLSFLRPMGPLTLTFLTCSLLCWQRVWVQRKGRQACGRSLLGTLVARLVFSPASGSLHNSCSGSASLQMPNVNHGKLGRREGRGWDSNFLKMTELCIQQDPWTPAARTTCGPNTEYIRPVAWLCVLKEVICSL